MKMILWLLIATNQSFASDFLSVSVPELPAGDLLLKKSAYTVGYNPHHKQADWVSYDLNPSKLRSCVERSNSFKPDSALPQNTSASLSDYSGSGYDRGHLIPAGDNRWNAAAMKESFLLSNISPQDPSFNRGIWSTLENLVRAWALKFNQIWVTTGPILNSTTGSIGLNQVSIPDAYYKVLVTRDEQRNWQGIAFVLPSTARGGVANIQGYAMSISKLESISGINFNPNLDADSELDVEQTFDLNFWSTQAKFSYLSCNQNTFTPKTFVSF